MRIPIKAWNVVSVITGVLLAAIPASAQTTWYVANDNCTGPGSGTESDPFCLIQDGIDAAVDGDTVLIADGTYTGFGNKNLSYEGRVITVQSQNGPNNCIIDCEASGRGFEFFNGETKNSVLDGLTIRHGQAESGGAISCHHGGRPTILNCVIADSSAEDAGGGILLGLGSSSTVVGNCLISGNVAQRGGGMACFESTGVISGCTFSDNVALGMGYGGGVYLGSGAPQFVHCLLQNNEGVYGGGLAVVDQAADPAFTNCVIRDNVAFQGGGAYCFNGRLALGNCLIVMNMATDDGGGVYADDCKLRLRNDIFGGNSATYGGALRVLGGGDNRVQNCVLWENVASAQGPEIAATGANTHVGVSYNDIQGGEDQVYVAFDAFLFWNEGNIDADPLFAGPLSDNFRLSAGSPCIDSASNSLATPDTADLDNDGDTDELVSIDLDGNPRFVDDPATPDTGIPDGVNPVIDMGAYELQVLILDLDIKPGACPNPFNRHGKGVLPVALVGTVEFDPSEVDLSTLQLSRADGVGGSVAPNEGPPGPHSVLADVASPFEGEGCECHDLGGDGIDDLSMKFRTDELVETLELDDLPGGAVVELVLSGSLIDGTAFVASDCITILPPGDTSPANAHVESTLVDTFVEVEPLDLNFDDDGFADFSRSYYGGTVMTLTAPLHSAGRRFMRWLVDTVPQPIGMRSIEIIVTEDTTLKAVYARPTHPNPGGRTEPDGPLE